ncbi:MAG: tryptophan synthase subunit beta like protein [Sterolibacteriaceae bacterium]|nr:tryptophan synthase subunit beta like protein [Candidatus Methylophosphatis haderslevensis]
MPYIHTDTAGNVISLHREATAEATERIAAGDPRVAAFLGRDVAGPNGEFLSLDLDLIRVLEDLVDVLIERNVITFTDLPAAAQEKIFRRRSKREKNVEGGILVDSFRLF